MSDKIKTIQIKLFIIFAVLRQSGRRVAQEHRASNRKIVKPWLRLPMRKRVAVSLRKTVNALSRQGPSSLPVMAA